MLWLPKETQEKLSNELKTNLKEDWDEEDDNLWSFDSRKWYESYSNVKIWIDFFNRCDEEDLEYEFARLGEDYDDIKIIGSDPYQIFSINRSIEIQ